MTAIRNPDGLRMVQLARVVVDVADHEPTGAGAVLKRLGYRSDDPDAQAAVGEAIRRRWVDSSHGVLALGPTPPVDLCRGAIRSDSFAIATLGALLDPPDLDLDP
jgi:hypothetical protein